MPRCRNCDLNNDVACLDCKRIEENRGKLKPMAAVDDGTPARDDFQIGARLREARQGAGLTQKQSGKLVGICQEQISKLEQGERKLSVLELIKFSEIYAVGYDWILGFWGEQDLPDELVAMCEKLPPIDRRKLLKTLATFGDMY
jgi:transcriptional regulator with XRE-family HTH domain